MIVHQHEGPSIEGIRVGFDWADQELRLVRASMLEAEGVSVPLEGEVRIPRERILFTQLVARSA